MNAPFNKLPHVDETHFIVANSQANAAENELWNSFRSGDRQALNTIFDRYGRIVFAYGRNITADQELIADCVQDVFVELWVKRETIAKEISSIKSYLIQCVRRRILRRLSAEKRLPIRSIPENYAEKVEFHIEADLIRDQICRDRSLQLNASLATLTIRQQEAVYLKFYENLSNEQIAMVMNTDVKGIYNLVGRSIVSLRRFFDLHPIICD